jgi:hypothetical protein
MLDLNNLVMYLMGSLRKKLEKIYSAYYYYCILPLPSKYNFLESGNAMHVFYSE